MNSFFNLIFLYLMHSDAEHHTVYATTVEYFYPGGKLEGGGESPSVLSPEEDVDSGGNLETISDMEGYFAVSENFVA